MFNKGAQHWTTIDSMSVKTKSIYNYKQFSCKERCS